MIRDWTFGRRLAVGFGLAGLTLLAIAAVAYRTTDGLIANNALVAHSYQVRQQLDGLLLDLKNAETGERGYVVTGDDAYLATYRTALGRIGGDVAGAQRLTAGNDRQQRTLTTMQPLIEGLLAQLKDTIDLRRNQGFDAAARVVAANQAKTFMDRITQLIDGIDQAEAATFARDDAAAQVSADLAMAIILWGGAAGLAMIGLIGWFIIRSLTVQIGSTVGRIQTSSAELQAAANQQATGAREQATATNEITTTISELLATSRQIAESAQRVAQIADQTAGAARSGHGTVELTRDSIAGIRRQVDQIVAYMLDLGRKSQQIGAVLEIVAELAEQTNILAINATIEAAGAGEAGRRFAVVADEIRKLADRVGGATGEIRTLIDDVRSAVNTTVMATETGSKAVDQGARQFTDLAAAFTQIAALVGTTTEAAREIELSTKQQSSAVEQVNLAIASVAQAARETETSSEETLKTASQLAQLSREHLRIVRPRAAV